MQTANAEDRVKFSVIIATYNRAMDLIDTLLSLAGLRPKENWEVIVVDNNSTDETASVVSEVARSFPVALRYLFEPEQGRCAALNAGIAAAQGEIIVTTDDDVRVEHDWLDRAAESLSMLNCDYVGGKVIPIWRGGRPDWLPNHGGRHWAVIALLDYGPEPLRFGKRVPLGVNMAFRSTAFTRAGLWNNQVGRKAGTLLGQEVREWGLRATAAGLRGFYTPTMIVQHVIPADRLNKRYFRRWFYWHGISRALLYKETGADMEAPEETPLELAKVPHIAGVPRYLFRTAIAYGASFLRALIRRDAVATFENELWLWFFAGIVAQRWRDRKSPIQNSAKRSPVTSESAVIAGVHQTQHN